MLKLSQYSLMAGLMLVFLALVCYILVLALGRSVRQAQAPVMAYAGGRACDADSLRREKGRRRREKGTAGSLEINALAGLAALARF